ncbi:MAG: triphosphoribosyl-dephospho-CoA synthase [Gammaproteobacteria bacterium]|nr:MAG: triphosphoribosyl-dephospho-CoA synthase [Gammaproteobacteria bacterium]
MTHPSQVSRLQDAVMNSFITEVNSLKPGNVSPYSEGHDMIVADFVKSAELATPILCDPSLSVGERILESVKLTMSEVGCNTNLGMLLLFAPLIRGAELGVAQLQSNLGLVLQELNDRDTACIFAAISHASPGGLGESEKYDVNQKLQDNITLQMAMTEAKDRDLIAKQYVTDFEDIFSTGSDCIEDFALRWNSVQWSAVACYMGFMAEFPDSHIRRKYGHEVAEQIKINAAPIATAFREQDSPEEATEMLMKFDKALKQKGVNPGTSADLTAASLLVYHLGKTVL